MYGVIDIGSNTIRLSFYKFSNGKIDPMMNKKEVAGLASYIKKNNKLSEDGISKVISVLKEYKQIVSKVDIQELFVFATASLRNISNTEEVLARIADSTGINAKVLSGDDEGRLGYLGAMQCADIDNGVLLDIGGGSTELVFYHNKQVVKTASMPIGSLNLYNKCVGDILPNKTEVKAMKEVALEEISKIYEPKLRSYAETICGVGGTARTICKIHNEMYHIPVENLQVQTDFARYILKSLSKDRRDMVDTILKVAPERIHTIIPGTIIMYTVARYFESRTMAVSRYGVREGFIYEAFRKRGAVNE